jgi:translation initiation factor IF-2
MSGYLNINEAEREELEECFFALQELLYQLDEIGLDSELVSETLNLERSRKIVAQIKGEGL